MCQYTWLKVLKPRTREAMVAGLTNAAQVEREKPQHKTSVYIGTGQVTDKDLCNCGLLDSAIQ